jgi:hypothetical protein
MLIRPIGLAFLLAASPVAAAQSPGLTVKTGETWVFGLSNGQPAKARRANADAKPGAGQIVVTVRSMMGTTMTITGNNPVAYTYKAELIGGEKAVSTRSCTLPAKARMSFENWPQKAKAVRLSDFKPATRDGACP